MQMCIRDRSQSVYQIKGIGLQLIHLLYQMEKLDISITGRAYRLHKNLRAFFFYFPTVFQSTLHFIIMKSDPYSIYGMGRGAGNLNTELILSLIHIYGQAFCGFKS